MKIGVLGGGESGVGAAILAKDKGNEVFVSDYGIISDSYKKELQQHNIRFEESGHSFEILESQDLIIKSPGISRTAEVIQRLIALNIPVIGEIEYAYRHCKGKIIGITGTNGKTTTTNLTHHLIAASGIKVSKGGNLGKCFARLVKEGYDWYVIEISSFQLEDIVEFRPDIAALLNLSPDHLDRYEYSIDNYLDAKCRVFMNQVEEDILFVPHDEKIIDKTIKGKMAVEVLDGKDMTSLDNLYLKGEHNQINALFASKMAVRAGASEEVVADELKTFVNDDHRLQPVARINEVTYINDSKATNVDAVYYALRAFDQQLIWIVGGVDKGNDYSLIAADVEKSVRCIVSIGTDNSKILSFFEGKGKEIKKTSSMKEAVEVAAELAQAGEVVLLSPACASFDLFDNYKDRGEQFVNEVWALLEK